MFSQSEALLLEMATPGDVGHYRALCTQMLAIGSRKAFLFTDAGQDKWTATMNRVMSEDALDAAQTRAGQLAGLYDEEDNTNGCD